MTTSVICLFALHLFLQFADAVITIRALENPKARELNPFAMWLIEKFGPERAMFGMKMTAVAVIFYFLPVTPWWALLGLNALYVGVIWKNLKVMKEMNKHE